jgi:hypothetical protein
MTPVLPDRPPRKAPVPLGQRLFDNIFLLLAGGLFVMLALYTGWGLLRARGGRRRIGRRRPGSASPSCGA